jgi:hypothetical protein
MAPPAPTILILGDSVIHSADVGILQAEFDANLVVPGNDDHFSRMYTSKRILGSRFKYQDRSSLMPRVIKVWAPAYLVVQGSIADITEIKNQPRWVQEQLASQSSNTLMRAVERALSANPAIITTVVLDRPPKFDRGVPVRAGKFPYVMPLGTLSPQTPHLFGILPGPYPSPPWPRVHTSPPLRRPVQPLKWEKGGRDTLLNPKRENGIYPACSHCPPAGRSPACLTPGHSGAGRRSTGCRPFTHSTTSLIYYDLLIKDRQQV